MLGESRLFSYRRKQCVSKLKAVCFSTDGKGVLVR